MALSSSLLDIETDSLPTLQIILTKPNASASQGSFLDIMRHPTLRLHTLIMYFNWFTTAFIMYGLALSWQVGEYQ